MKCAKDYDKKKFLYGALSKYLNDNFSGKDGEKRAIEAGKFLFNNEQRINKLFCDNYCNGKKCSL